MRTILPRIDSEQLPGAVVLHPLDFVCMPLWRKGGLGLCLHVWPWSEEKSSPIIHAHSWDLWSYVICGTILNDVMSVRDEGERPEFALYVVTSRGRVDEFQETGRLVTCARRERQEIQAGQIYRLSSGRFHRSGHRGFTATLVLGEQREGLDNLVLGSVGGYQGSDLPRETCSADDARALIERIATQVR
ncbi:hypothetical protein G9272_32535 [Streptomyces asoensis]|uniref:Uncharacterized protein n=1 Tax=Streptomyces asoensis TaxID=249586 RepID=A0A6M4WWY3_9ACTN|nr:hypothetical protein [Streptomyces asoensis]QJT04442.1 hypothetical protein G9272_32535 [Streptomyces asoensis]